MVNLFRHQHHHQNKCVIGMFTLCFLMNWAPQSLCYYCLIYCVCMCECMSMCKCVYVECIHVTVWYLHWLSWWIEYPRCQCFYIVCCYCMGEYIVCGCMSVHICDCVCVCTLDNNFWKSILFYCVLMYAIWFVQPVHKPSKTYDQPFLVSRTLLFSFYNFYNFRT